MITRNIVRWCAGIPLYTTLLPVVDRVVITPGGCCRIFSRRHLVFLKNYGDRDPDTSCR